MLMSKLTGDAQEGAVHTGGNDESKRVGSYLVYDCILKDVGSTLIAHEERR